MPHEVTPDSEHLEFLHSQVMKAIYEVINQDNPFKHRENVYTLGLDCVSIAKKVYSKLSSSMSNLDQMIKGRKEEFETFGAFPIKDDKLAQSVEQIYIKLLEHIDNIPPTLLERLLKSSAELADGKENIFGINKNFPPFKSKEGDLQPVSTGDQKKSGEKLFRAHLCKVQMKAGKSVAEELQTAIANRYVSLVHADGEANEEEYLAEINRKISQLFDDNENSAILGLRELLDKESSGLISREVGIVYLEYLLENAKRQSIDTAALEKICQKIRWVENYIHHPDRSNSDCMYQVTDEHSCDLRELFGLADAFTNLPVIGRIDGNIEERSSQEERAFVFGIRFKANNPVTTPDRDFPELGSSSSVYARHLAKAIKVLELAKQFNTGQGDEKTDYGKLRHLGKSIKTVFLYYMVFSKKDSEKIKWWEDTAGLLHKREPKALDRLLKLANILLAKEKQVTDDIIAPAVATLKNILKNSKACLHPEIRRCILLEKYLVTDDIEEALEGDIFIKDLEKSDKNILKKCLRYVRIVKEAEIPADALYSIPFYISFSDTFFYANREKRRRVRVGTEPEIWQFLPVLVQPQISEEADKLNIYHKPLTKTASLMVQIMPDIEPNKSNTLEFFIYKVTSAVVFLLGISALCQKLPQQNLAIPLLRLHQAGKTDDAIEKYLAAVCASVTFLLNEKYTAGMQGIQLINFTGNQRELGYRVTNSRSSLYAFLPKTFIAQDFAPAFKKLAIVIVTSRAAGKHRHSDNKHNLVNLFGRVVMFEHVDGHRIELRPNFLTFADNLIRREIDTHPKILIDTIHRLYDEYGVRDVLYIAKTPFTSNLNLTQKNPYNALYFMSETVLQEMMRNRADLNIYPVFCGKYPAHMFGGTKLPAIYIDDVPSIQKHVQMDRTSESQIVTFLNIANGVKVKGKDAEKNFFNNVLCYATLDNIYTDRTLQSRILERMIAPDSLPRQTLIDFICLLHTAAYEKVENELKLKLNPYQDILEDNNVNRLNTFPAFPKGKPDLNLFAFMTKIQRIISLIGKK